MGCRKKAAPHFLSVRTLKQIQRILISEYLLPSATKMMTQDLCRDTQTEIVADCNSILGWERFLALLLIGLDSMANLFDLRKRHLIINESHTPIGLIVKVNVTFNSLAENFFEELLKEGVKVLPFHLNRSDFHKNFLSVFKYSKRIHRTTVDAFYFYSSTTPSTLPQQ